MLVLKRWGGVSPSVGIPVEKRRELACCGRRDTRRCLENGLKCSVHCHSSKLDCDNLSPLLTRTEVAMVDRDSECTPNCDSASAMSRSRHRGGALSGTRCGAEGGGTRSGALDGASNGSNGVDVQVLSQDSGTGTHPPPPRPMFLSR